MTYSDSCRKLVTFAFLVLHAYTNAVKFFAPCSQSSFVPDYHTHPSFVPMPKIYCTLRRVFASLNTAGRTEAEKDKSF
ncbi:hypothetical protein F4776DRAFT_195386 [Hypoxylon sp. NC0597]|nr:hypothetical protein F4776DRAFT_195386 [Hypoxylon sp. NC0597]